MLNHKNRWTAYISKFMKMVYSSQAQIKPTHGRNDHESSFQNSPHKYKICFRSCTCKSTHRLEIVIKKDHTHSIWENTSFGNGWLSSGWDILSMVFELECIALTLQFFVAVSINLSISDSWFMDSWISGNPDR